MPLVAVDWGTSSLRAARLDGSGRVLEEMHVPRGILTVPAGGFPALFDELLGAWMRAPGARCLISGMAGSRQGWVEAPYCACPADAADIASRTIDIEPGRVALAPGLCDEHDGVPDVMRGEEVQILGAMALAGLADGLCVLPGTHSKWARVEGGRILGFRTFMTGEFYALLSRHSILARTLEADAPLDAAAFLQGVAQSDNGEGLLHNAFGARTLALFDRLPAAALASYLSGLLIGEELRTQSLHAVRELVLIGAPSLTQRYALALRERGITARTLGDEATWAGLHTVATHHFASP